MPPRQKLILCLSRFVDYDDVDEETRIKRTIGNEMLVIQGTHMVSYRTPHALPTSDEMSRQLTL